MTSLHFNPIDVPASIAFCEISQDSFLRLFSSSRIIINVINYFTKTICFLLVCYIWKHKIIWIEWLICVSIQNNQIQFSSVQFSHSVVSNSLWPPWTTECQASLSITNSRSPPKPMSIELMMPSNHLILCRPLLLPSIFPSIRVFSNESALRIRWPKYWSFSFNVSPSNEHSNQITHAVY